MSNYIININDGQRYSTPVVNRFSSDFDRIRFVLDLSRDLSSYSFGIVAAVCGECFMITEDDEKLVKGYEESTGRITLDWSVGTEITAKDGVVIYQIIAFSADSDGNMKSIWYSPEGRVTVGESIELTEYETAQIGTKPSIIMQLLAKVSSNELSFKELKDADLAHKTEVILDHPDGSVVRAKLSEDLIKILDEAVSKDYFRNIVSPLSDNVELLNENTQILDRRMTEAEENIADNQKAISDITEKLNSNTITSNAKGSKIHIDDSAQAPLGQLNVYGHTKQIYTSGKNMIPYPYHDGNTKSANGITFSINDNGCISFNGTATADTVYTLYNNYSMNNINVLTIGETYTLSGNSSVNTSNFIIQVAVRLYKDDGSYDTKFIQVTNAPVTYTVPSNYKSAYFFNSQIRVYTGFTAKNISVYPIFEKGKTASAYEPYTGCFFSPSPEWPQSMTTTASDGTLKINTFGKNLIDTNKFIELIKSYDNTATVVTEEGRRCIRFMNKALLKKDFNDALHFSSDKIYTWSMDVKFDSSYSQSGDFIFGFLYGNEIPETAILTQIPDGTSAYNRYRSLTATDASGFITTTGTSAALPFAGIGFSYGSAAYWFIDLDSIQIAEGETVTPYEPYKGTSLTLSTPNGLPGIPVPSDGNYTDENGQQWVCDEIDLAKGIYIQRIGSSTLPEFSYVSIYSGTDAGDIYEGFASCAFPCTDAGALCEKAKFVVNRSDYRATEFMLSPTIGMESWCDLNVYCIAEDEEDFRSRLRGASILYILSSPQEKPLSDEEIDAYNRLLTYKPTTNITNDADAYMAVEYAADPKGYIDGKLAALTAAMNLAGVNVNG